MIRLNFASQKLNKMSVTKNTQAVIFAGRATADLAEKIAVEHGTSLGNSIVLSYADGEFQPSFEENVRGRDVFIVQSTFPPTDNLFELLMLIDAAKRASAKRIIAVIPYFGFARQDRKDKPRVPIAAKLIADLLQTAGVHRVITMDLHADQIQGFFDIPVDHLYGSSLFIPHIKKLGYSDDDLLFASPDIGGSRRAGTYAKHMGIGFVICYKQRNKPNEVGVMQLIGDVENKHVVLLDDIIDTGSTMIKAAQLLKDNGAKTVRAMATHGVLSGNAIENIDASVLEELLITDTIPLKKESSKIKVLSTAWLFAETIRRVTNFDSISNLYEITVGQR